VPPESDRPYHHGDLANAIMRALEEIILEKGADAVTMREAARRAGVSHSAPAHHFGDKDGMLEAFSIEGFHMLADALTEQFLAVADKPVRQQLAAMGKAYLVFAHDNPAHYEIMMGLQMEHGEEYTPLFEASDRAYLPLALVVNRLGEEGLIDPEHGRYIATMLWGMVHGVADLWLSGKLPHFYEDHSFEELVDALMDDMSGLVLPADD
jgi:AcrR family transcriptional regulator